MKSSVITRPKYTSFRPRKIVRTAYSQRPRTGLEIARNSVESQRLSTFIDYATLAPFAIDCLETALAIDDSNSGICLWPMTLRNWRSATSRPEPTQRSM